MLDDFVEQNIDRLIKQCNGGDEAITFLAIYSFIEGFFREKYPNDFKWEKDIKFHQIIDLVKSRHLATSFPAESTLYDTLKKYHGEKDKNAYKNLKTFTDTNRVLIAELNMGLDHITLRPDLNSTSVLELLTK